MMNNLDVINRLVNSFTKLPGVGYKTAERYAYRIIDADDKFVDEFVSNILAVRELVKFCMRCANFAVADFCNICEKRRDAKSIMVVRDPRDIVAIEKSGVFTGSYHVLHGVLDPLNKKGVNDINLKSLIIRIREEKTEEIIIATNPDIEGEATANYIAGLVKPSGIKITRPAQGLSIGTNMEYADENTLGAAIRNRTVL